VQLTQLREESGNRLMMLSSRFQTPSPFRFPF
jgi:hypothetical protein